MVRVLSLLLPALIPSWRFFKAVEPSPRVQWAVIGQGGVVWQDYRPRPPRLSMMLMIQRLFWNPHWNDTLYMVSLAERLTITPNAATLADIWHRIAQDVALDGRGPDPVIQFRLLFVSRDGDQITSEVTYLSDPRAYHDI
jgi:hypothetical protein